MIKEIIVLFVLISIFGCKSTQTNQVIDKKREGKWVSVYVMDSIEYKSIEHYKHDEPVKKWKQYINGKIYKTEKYKNRISLTKSYYENGKLESKGKTKLEKNSIEMHWFYFGDWKFYSDKGKLVMIKKYENGDLISEKKI